VSERILVVCAHPDDEVLGIGGTLILEAKTKKIFVLIIADGESSRGNFSRVNVRKKQAKNACSIIGINKLEFLDYPDQKLDVINSLEISQKIENVIKKWKPNTVYTHSNNDLNQDHRKVFEATSIAVRPLPESRIKKFYCFETMSSTEWGFNEKFNPNCFVNIESVINKKLKAVSQYKQEIREYPHPRSIESIKNRAKYWGTIVGIRYAEAFQMIREIK